MTQKPDKRIPNTNQRTGPVTDGSAQKTKPSSSAKIMALLILVFGAIGCALYSLKTTLDLQKSTLNHSESLATELSLLKQEQTASKALLNTHIKSILTSQNQVQDQLSLIEKNYRATLQQHGYQSNDWIVLKARYYLELAQINTQWSDDLQTTIALLKQADRLLLSFHDPQIYPVRQAIAKEISQIDALPKADVPGLLSQLVAIADVATHLPLKSNMPPSDKTNLSVVNHESSSSWSTHFKQSLSLLEKLVVIQHRNEDVTPLLSPAYEALLREQIQLNVQEAQWAVLQNNDAVYHGFLDQILKNIHRSFAENAPETKTILSQLETLQKIHLSQQKPLQQESLQLLNQWIESKDSTPPTISPSTPKEKAK